MTAIQHPPVFLDLEESVKKACDLISQAAQGGAKLIVFPETWLPCYPVWLDVAPGAALWAADAATAVYRRLYHLDLALFNEIPGEPDDFLMRGGSTIIAPNVECLAGPLYEEAGMVSAEIVPERAIDGHLAMDVTGHYSRPDVFQLHVNTKA